MDENFFPFFFFFFVAVWCWPHLSFKKTLCLLTFVDSPVVEIMALLILFIFKNLNQSKGIFVRLNFLSLYYDII